MDNVKITDQSITDFFHQGFQAECQNISLKLTGESHVYIVNLAVRYLHSDQLFVQDEDGRSLPTLAYLYRDALASNNQRERSSLIQTLGDTALFLAAFFPGVWQRRGLKRSYFIDMSESAFRYLAELSNGQASHFQELAEHNDAIAHCLGNIIKP